MLFHPRECHAIQVLSISVNCFACIDFVAVVVVVVVVVVNRRAISYNVVLFDDRQEMVIYLKQLIKWSRMITSDKEIYNIKVNINYF